MVDQAGLELTEIHVSASLIRSKGLHHHAQLIRAVFNLKSINISWEYSSVIEILPGMHRALVSILSTQKGRETIRDIKHFLSQQKILSIKYLVS